MNNAKKYLLLAVLALGYGFFIASPTHAAGIEGSAGPCTGDANTFTCSWTDERGWYVNEAAIVNCGTSQPANALCSGRNLKQFSEIDPNQGTSVCLPCTPKIKPTKGHGETCADSSECSSGFICKTSTQGGKKCLSSDLGVTSECVIGESECKPTDFSGGTPQGVPMTCKDVAAGDKFGRCDSGTLAPNPSPTGQLFDLCKQVTDTNLAAKCNDCYTKFGPSSGTWTAIGCINTSDSGQAVIATIIKVGLSIAGGAGLLMIITAGFIFSVSQGDQKRVGQARDMLTAAVIGLLFIIFSVTILQFIGVTIFHIPGFGK